MYDFHPYFTNDGSVGLYNTSYNDIYHSATGALTEAMEKFIFPVDFDLLLKKDKINVLDICYGIGYNTKSFLNFLYEKFFRKSYFMCNYYETIYTNNIWHGGKGNVSIYGDNIFNKISIDTVDNDEILFFISPFLKTGVKTFSNNDIDFDYPNIDKFLQDKGTNIVPKINELINFLILDKIAQFLPKFTDNTVFNDILSDKTYNKFLEGKIKGLYQNLYKSDDKSTFGSAKWLNLHNIYYKYLSKHYKNDLKAYKLQDINFRPHVADAREFIKNTKKSYDLIFLDAFTPSKCPCLWSLEFFKELFNHLNEDGMLLTYSMAAPVRNAMTLAGFCVGNNFNPRTGKNIGTIAVKNPALLKYPLSEFDFGLLKTKSGIVYRDENLMSQNEAIIEARNLEVKNSNLISSSQYKKSKLL